MPGETVSTPLLHRHQSPSKYCCKNLGENVSTKRRSTGGQLPEVPIVSVASSALNLNWINR